MFATYAEARLPPGAFTDGEIVDHAAVAEVLSATATAAGIFASNVALSESKSYLFETTVPWTSMLEWRIAIEQHL